MLIEKNYVIKIENKDEAEEIINGKCNFVNKLIGVYFFDTDKDFLFDAEYADNKLYLYCRNIRRTFFNPLIIVEFSRKYLTVTIKYNLAASLTIIILSLLLLIAGIFGLYCGFIVIGFLPLIFFWFLIFISFTINSNKIIKEFDKLIVQNE